LNCVDKNAGDKDMLKRNVKRRNLTISLWNLERNLDHKLNYKEKQRNFKEGLREIYDDNEHHNYKESTLLKRLQYLQNGVGLYQAFYISLFISGIFFVLSLFLPNIMGNITDYTQKTVIHQYMLKSNTYYEEGYEQGARDAVSKNKDEFCPTIDLDKITKSQEENYMDGYNYAFNNGYDFGNPIHLLLWTIFVYCLGIISLYFLFKRQEMKFNKYQTNSFEIALISKKLGIAEKETKYYRVKLKNQGKKVKAIVDEMEITEEVDHINTL
jgi:hypothetical protein